MPPMTRHNLNDHLPWLLTTKPSVPPSRSDLPAIPSTFPPVDHTQPDVEFPAARLQSSDAMVRMKSAPSPAAKKILAPMSPVPKTDNFDNAVQKIPESPRLATKRENPATPSSSAHQRWTTRTRDVEIMDLTESGSRKEKDILRENYGQFAGRKRKSGELEAEYAGHTSSGTSTRPKPMAVIHSAGSQDGFADIDEIMAESADPPPPYSTLAPKSFAGASRSPAVKRQKSLTAACTMPDSDDDEFDDDDDKLVNFAGAISKTVKLSQASPSKSQVLYKVAGTPVKHELSQKKSYLTSPTCGATNQIKSQFVSGSRAQAFPEANLEDTASSAEVAIMTCSASAREARNVDSELLKRTFALSPKHVRKLLDDIDGERDVICENIAIAYDNDDEDRGTKLQHELDDMDARTQAIQELTAKRDEYERICSEKEQLFAALRHAIKTRLPQADAKAANNAGKLKLAEFEAECWDILVRCREDVDRLLDTRNDSEAEILSRAVAVKSSPIREQRLNVQDHSITSSSRVAQTQMPRLQQFQYSNFETTRLDLSSERHDRVSKTPAVPASTKHDLSYYDISKPNDHEFDDLHDDEILEATDVIANNFAPSARVAHHTYEADEFDFDEHDMLDLAIDSNSNNHRDQASSSATRTVLGETSGNSCLKSSPSSAKKSKAHLPTFNNYQVEAQYRKFPWFEEVKVALKERFHLRGFREHQLDAIAATLAGKDAFVLMPTGGGKSLCYQLPSLITSGKTTGITIVVSPLLSLMEDQVQHLRNLNIEALLINSETPLQERNDMMASLRQSNVQEFAQLLYITPEMLSKSQAMMSVFDGLYKRNQLARLVIDEAHCVSQWGHDFRPDYKTIGEVRKRFPNVPVMALTATATEGVKNDTIHNLGIDGCEVFTRSFNRANLYYEVRKKSKAAIDVKNIAAIIKDDHANQCGIVYCLSRKTCEDIAKQLSTVHKIKAHHYHAGMDSDTKKETQKLWQAGRYKVIVATIAFGMGIDKADVRFVIHHSMPKSLEGYYQETGRAGRDGQPSHCYLFFAFHDMSKLQHMIDKGEGSYEQKDRQRDMLVKMVQYCANTADCRRTQVLGYFSERFDSKDCRNGCDNCNARIVFNERDLTEYANMAVQLVSRLETERVTFLHCIDVFRGGMNKKIKANDSAHKNLNEYGAGSDLHRGDVERLFYHLLGAKVLCEKHVIRGGFPHSYIELGRKVKRHENGTVFAYTGNSRFKMRVQVNPDGEVSRTSAKATSDQAGQKGKGSRPRNADAASRVEAPLSTNVSSPVQAASSRKTARPKAKINARSKKARDSFIASDDDFGKQDADSSTEDDAFEPVRVRGVVRKEAQRMLGPPITSDSTIDSLAPLHRMVVDHFLAESKKKSNEIMLAKNLTVTPFPDTILRQMIINFTETEDAMSKIKGIDAERVRLWGKIFCKLVKKWHATYLEWMEGAQEQANAVDVHAQNVINLLTDDEEEAVDDDDYGSLNEWDFDEEASAVEHSLHSQPSTSKRAEQPNANFSRAHSHPSRGMVSRAPKRSPSKGKAARSRNYPTISTNDSKLSASRRGAGNRVAKKTQRSAGDRSKRSSGASARKGNSGIAMMPF